MTSFSEHFGLRDSSRTSFGLDPDRDAELFVDLDGLEERLEKELNLPSPKLVLQGDFGTGKTHILRLIERKFAPQLGHRPVYIELGGFGKKSNFRDLYIVVMARLEGVLLESLTKLVAAKQPGGLESILKAHESMNSDILSAFRRLADPNEKEKANIRAWLLGTGPTPSQARRINFAGRLFEFADPPTLVGIWKICGQIIARAQSRRLLLLIDEGEVFSRVVDPDAQAHIGAGLRNLFDQSNHDIGCVFGINTPDVRQGVHPFERSDLASRVSTKKILLKPLEGEDRVIRFYESLWRMLSALPALLNQRAKVLLGQQAQQMHAAISVEPRTRAVTQRKVVQILDYVGSRAMESRASLPLTERELRAWFNLAV